MNSGEGDQVKGFIKDYRKEVESDIWMMPPLYHRVWQWLKYMMNHEDNQIPMRDGSKMPIKRGQHLTSVREVAKAVGWYEGAKRKEPNPKTIDSILKFMEKTDMISIERGQGNRQYTLITLIKYDEYQDKKSEGNSKVTVSGEGSKQRADINKNDKECLKNDKEVIYRKFAHLSLSVKEYEKLIKDGYTKVQIDDMLDSVENYKKNTEYLSLNLTIRKWLKREESNVKPRTSTQNIRHGGNQTQGKREPEKSNISKGRWDHVIVQMPKVSG